MCCRSTPIKSIRFRYSTKTAKPPNGVTARSVSRSFRRSPDSRALISRWTALSDEKFCMHLFSQTDAPHSKPYLRISGLVIELLRRNRIEGSSIEHLGESRQHSVVLPMGVGLFQSLDLVQVSVDQLANCERLSRSDVRGSIPRS